MNRQPIRKTLVLVGGGHSHALVLRQWGMNPLPGVRLVLISDVTHTPYSGMLPGYVSGAYTYDEVHIDLRRLARFAGAEFLLAPVTGVDRGSRRVHLAGRPPVSYDLLSINTGSRPQRLRVPGAAAYAVPAKPVPHLIAGWERTVARAFETPREPGATAIVGGGAGGVELALAMQARLAQTATEVHLIHRGSELLETHNERVRRILTRLLQKRNVHLHVSDPVTEVTETGAVLRSGTFVPATPVFWVTEAAAPRWLAESGFSTTEDGFLRVSQTLRVMGEENVFAAGDVATMEGHPRPKSGVYAVRAAKPLARNLRRLLRGQPLEHHRPQKEALNLIGTASRAAVASRGRWAAVSPWLWAFKDRIDRKFMDKFSRYPDMNAPLSVGDWLAEMPWLTRLRGDEKEPMRCQGCGAKLGAPALRRALSRVGRDVEDADRRSHFDPRALSDDGAISTYTRPVTLVDSLDFMPALIDDPYTFARIAAVHAFSDLFAMGARPVATQLLVTLPYASPEVGDEWLYQVISGTVETLDRFGAQLVGGHTAEAERLGIGLSVRGDLEGDPFLKKGLAPGQLLILTKPLGTGLLFAGHMRLAAKGWWIDQAVENMLQDHGAAVEVFRSHGVNCVTDVTGFGLVGHLWEMAQASCASVTVEADGLPALEGAETLAHQGIESSLAPQNRALFPQLNPHSPQAALAIDPQTSGGLLAAVDPDKAEPVLEQLHAAGYGHAAIVGRVIGAERAALAWNE